MNPNRPHGPPTVAPTTASRDTSALPTPGWSIALESSIGSASVTVELPKTLDHLDESTTRAALLQVTGQALLHGPTRQTGVLDGDPVCALQFADGCGCVWRGDFDMAQRLLLALFGELGDPQSRVRPTKGHDGGCYLARPLALVRGAA